MEDAGFSSDNGSTNLKRKVNSGGNDPSTSIDSKRNKQSPSTSDVESSSSASGGQQQRTATIRSLREIMEEHSRQLEEWADLMEDEHVTRMSMSFERLLDDKNRKIADLKLKLREEKRKSKAIKRKHDAIKQSLAKALDDSDC